MAEPEGSDINESFLMRAVDRALLNGTDPVDELQAALRGYLQHGRETALVIGDDGIIRPHTQPARPLTQATRFCDEHGRPTTYLQAPAGIDADELSYHIRRAMDTHPNCRCITTGELDDMKTENSAGSWTAEFPRMRDLRPQQLTGPWPQERGRMDHWRLVSLDDGMVIFYHSPSAEDAVDLWNRQYNANRKVLLVPPSKMQTQEYRREEEWRDEDNRPVVRGAAAHLAFDPLPGMRIEHHLNGFYLLFEKDHPLWPLAAWWARVRLVNPADLGKMQLSFQDSIRPERQERFHSMWSVCENETKIPLGKIVIKMASSGDDVCHWFLDQLYRGHWTAEGLVAFTWIIPPQGALRSRTSWDLLEL